METKKFTILIVDDEEVLRETVAYDFEKKGFTVLEASNGIEALEVLKAQPADIILSDVRMPHGSGTQLLDQIKKENPIRPSVILVSGFTDSLLYEIYDRGADAIFSKPYDREDLMKSVVKLLAPKELAWKQVNLNEARGEKIRLLNLPWNSQQFKIGRGGVFISLSREKMPPVGTQVSFHLQLKGGPIDTLSGSGMVRWMRSKTKGDLLPGVGIELIDLSDECLEPFATYINQQKPRAFIPQ